MTPLWVEKEIERALGRPLSGVGEQRLARILYAVLASGDPLALWSVTAACDVYVRLMEQHALDPAPPALIDVTPLALAASAGE